jgi:hypothetical protein
MLVLEIMCRQGHTVVQDELDLYPVGYAHTVDPKGVRCVDKNGKDVYVVGSDPNGTVACQDWKCVYKVLETQEVVYVDEMEG